MLLSSQDHCNGFDFLQLSQTTWIILEVYFSHGYAHKMAPCFSPALPIFGSVCDITVWFLTQCVCITFLMDEIWHNKTQWLITNLFAQKCCHSFMTSLNLSACHLHSGTKDEITYNEPCIERCVISFNFASLLNHISGYFVNPYGVHICRHTNNFNVGICCVWIYFFMLYNTYLTYIGIIQANM